MIRKAPIVRKALMAAAGAGLTGLGTSMLDGALTWPEATVAAGLALIAGAATWWIPNAPAEAPPPF